MTLLLDAICEHARAYPEKIALDPCNGPPTGWQQLAALTQARAASLAQRFDPARPVALQLDPDGLDANYFMGDYMLDQGDKAAARGYLQKALRAPHDTDRPAWDAGRRREVQALLVKAK